MSIDTGWPSIAEDGFIVNAPTPNTLRLVPALTLTVEQADTFVEWLGASPLLGAATQTGATS
jgi:acetylornithine aminotransferase